MRTTASNNKYFNQSQLWHSHLDNETSSVKILEKNNIPFPLSMHMKSVFWLVSVTSVEAQAPTQGGWLHWCFCSDKPVILPDVPHFPAVCPGLHSLMSSAAVYSVFPAILGTHLYIYFGFQVLFLLGNLRAPREEM